MVSSRIASPAYRYKGNDHRSVGSDSFAFTFTQCNDDRSFGRYLLSNAGFAFNATSALLVGCALFDTFSASFFQVQFRGVGAKVSNSVLRGRSISQVRIRQYTCLPIHPSCCARSSSTTLLAPLTCRCWSPGVSTLPKLTNLSRLVSLSL